MFVSLVFVIISFCTIIKNNVYGNVVSDFCDGTYTVDDWINDFIVNDNAFVVSNAAYTGNCNAAGKIEFSGSTHYIESQVGSVGLIISSGSINTAADISNDAGGTSQNNGLPGDSDLDALSASGIPTFDASVIEFDVTSIINHDISVSFKYIFGSEEYNEYANSQYNDLFAFFVDGNNVAQVLNTSSGEYVEVSINNINLISLPEYYLNNDNDNPVYATEYDGLTIELTTIPFVLQPNIPVHIKLAIADRTDYVWDSAVYLEGGSFVEVTDAPTSEPTESCDNDVLYDKYGIEVCENNPCGCDEPNLKCKDGTCHANGCDQCKKVLKFFKLDYNYKCRKCKKAFGENCMHCTDFLGCNQCVQGSVRTWDPDCGLYYCDPPTFDTTSPPE